MALGPFAVTAARAMVVDYATTLYADASLLMAARGHPEVDPWGFLLPFAPSLWAATLGGLGIVVVAAAMMMLAATTQKARLIRETLRSMWQAVFSFLFVCCGILFQQGNTASSLAEIIILFFFLLFIYFHINSTAKSKTLEKKRHRCRASKANSIQKEINLVRQMSQCNL